MTPMSVRNPPMGNDDRLLGLDIGGTTCAALIGTAGGTILQRCEWPSESARGAAAMIDDLVRQAHALRRGGHSLRAAGVAVGGPLDADRGIVLSPPNLPGWDHVKLKAILEERLQLPVRVEHDAAACALAEYEWGMGRTARRLIYLTCATGFGAGMVFDGEPYYGISGRSPEIGHVLLDARGPSAFGRRGCAEAFCSARSLGRLAAWTCPQRWPEAPEPGEIQRLAAGGDKDAIRVIETNARMTGRVCALLCDLLQPDHIALGSLARYLGNSWVEQVRRETQRLALPDAFAQCRIEPARLGEALQDLSALAAARRALGRQSTA